MNRRRFLAALAALPFLGPVLERICMRDEPAPVTLTKVVGRVEITEETRRKIQPSRDTFLSWAELRGAELERFDRHFFGARDPG